MEKGGLVSVVIPVYNVEQYLRQCVESVLRQTYQNLEILLIDDGSTDGSGAICDEYAQKDQRIRVIHQKNAGLSMARNEGLRQAVGAYVYFLDSDDWIDGDAMESLVKAVEENKAQMVFFNGVSFQGDHTPCERQSYVRKTDYGRDTGLNMLRRIQEQKDYHSAVPMLFMKREFLTKNHLSFEPGIVYEDMLFTFQAYCLADEVFHLNRQLYHRRYRSGSITSVKKTELNFQSSKVVFEKAASFAVERKLLCDATKQYITRCAFNAINNYCQMERGERKHCKEECRALKREILDRKDLSSKSLRARCHGKLPWTVVRAFEKIGVC